MITKETDFVGRRFGDLKIIRRVVMDHCHVTGKFRGLVCRLCNVVLGRFRDDSKLLHKAIKYLNKHIKDEHEPILDSE